MKRVMLSFLVLLSVFGLNSQANAGVYAGVDGGFATFASGYKLLNTSSSSKTGQLFDIHAGYRLGEIIAAEVGYAKIANVKVNVGGSEKNVSTDVFHVSGLAYLPLPTLFTAMLDIYGRFGIGYTKGAVDDHSHSKTSMIYGIGAEFNYLPLIAFRAEAQHIPDFGVSNNPLTTFKVGVNVKF